MSRSDSDDDDEMTLEEYNKLVGLHKPGSIKRLRLKNFLTYAEAELNAGPRLNMVIGPNGTGKSTILCAFCLGLGGEPPVLGRADDARLFIMHDQEEAIIEIELEPLKGGETHVFKRKIERSKGGRNGRGASTFYINNQKTTAKEVQELVTKTYHIAVKNLCQFLPQDRVGNFSGFTPQELLVETEKSMNGNGQLYETHQKLIDMEHELKNSGSEVETIESKLKRLVADNERLEREKERMEEREEAERQLKLLNFKYLWLQFDACREAAKELKGAKDAAKEALRVQNETLQPLEEAHSLLVTQKQRYDARAKTLETNLKKAVKEQEKQYEKAEKHQDELDTTLSSLVSIETASRKAAQDIERAKEQLAKMEAAMEDLPSMELCDEAQKEASAEYNRLRGPFENAKRELVRAHGAIKDKNEEKNQMVHKLARMNDEKTQRKQKVFAAFRELQEISDWIDHNKAQFRRPVWGPIACEVTTKSNNAAASLEHHVPNATLKSFVVECKEDYDLLYSKIRREKNLPINVLIVPNGKLQDIDRKYSANKMRILKEEHGISGYLDEAFTAPDAIIQALRNSAQVHNVLVGGTKTQAHIDSKGLLDFLGEPVAEGQGLRGYCIFASKGQRSFRYTGTVSKYSKKLAMSQDELRGSRFLSPGVNPEHKKRLEDEIKSINAELLELERTHHELLSRKDDLEKQAQDAFARLRHAKETITEVTKKQKARERAQRKLRDLEKAAVSDSDDEKMKLVRAIQARMKASVTALEAHADQQRNIMKHTFSLAGVRINLDTSVAAIRRAEESLKEARKGHSEAQAELARVTKEFNDKKASMRQAKALAENEAPLEDAEGNALPLKAELEALAVSTLAETEAAMEDANAKVNGIDANPEVIRQYEERKMEIEIVKAQLSDLTESKEAKTNGLQKLKGPWEESLDAAVAKVNILFSQYMQELGCAGEVKLTKGGDDERREGDDISIKENFKNWGIAIRVKFREGSKLQTLSARVQSGGERSVSTIMYLMALQSMMSSPFRCVDEINQGLDERNERLVFQRIVENSTQPPSPGDLTDHSGQYFLITPKMLPNMEGLDNEAMTIQCIINGPGGFDDPKDWNPNEIIRAGKRRSRDDNHEEEGSEEDENSGPSRMNEESSSKVPRKKKRRS